MQQRSVLSLLLVAACSGDGNGQVAAPLESCAAADLDVAAVCSGNTQITASASEATATPIDVGVTYAITGPGAGKRGYVVFTSEVSGTFTLYSSDDPMRVCDVEPLCRSTELDCEHLDRAARYDVVAGLPYVIELRPQATTAYLHVAAPADEPDPDPQLAFDPPRFYAAGTTPYHVTLGDLDGDQDLDLAVATPDDAGGQTTIDLLRNDGGGAFSLVDQIFTSAPSKAVIADWNLDGQNDIAGIGWDGQGPLPGYYLVNQGGFMFENQPWSSGIDFEAHGGVPADFDEDGTPELLAAYRDSNGVTDVGGFVILDVPAFTPIQDEPAFGVSTGQAVAGDFDGDGHQDVLVVRFNDSTVRFHRGDGSGRVTFDSELSLDAPVRELFAFDLDGDGRSELVSINTNATISVISNLTDSMVLTPLAGADDVAAGDLDGDGSVDLAFIGDGGIAIYVARDGGFEQGLVLEAPDTAGPHSVTIGDVDGDGRHDITATALDAIAVYLAN